MLPIGQNQEVGTVQSLFKSTYALRYIYRVLQVLELIYGDN